MSNINAINKPNANHLRPSEPIIADKTAAVSMSRRIAMMQQAKAPSAAAALSSAAPPLPDVQGPFASTLELQKVASLPKQTQQSFGLTMSAAMAFSLMLEILQQINRTTAGFKRNANQLQHAQQLQAAGLSKTKTEGDRRAAGFNLAWAVGGAMATGVFSGIGASSSNFVLMSLGNAANSLSNTVGTYFDTNFSFGGRYRADEAQNNKQYVELLANISSGQYETFKDANNQAVQHVQELISQLRNIAANKYEVASTIARNIG